MKNDVNDEIVLIGPIGVGKSTLGELIAKELNVPSCSLDDVWRNYAQEIGYDSDFAKSLQERGGFWASYTYRKEFCCYAVEKVLSEYHNCVFDFGAGHSVYEIDSHFTRVQKALELFRNVVLVLPSPDESEAIRTLAEVRPDMPKDIKAHFLAHHSNYDLAKFTVYTKGKSPEQTKVEILDYVYDSGQP